MADKLPVKAKFSVGSPTYVVGLQEFEPTDTINVSLISGFSTAVTSELGNNSINSLGDINVPSPSDGQVLTYNSTSGLWEAVTPIDNDISAVWGNITGTLSNQTDLQNALNNKANILHSHSLNDLTDVDVVSPFNNQVLTWNSINGSWEPQTVSHDRQIVSASNTVSTNSSSYITLSGMSIITKDLNSNGTYNISFNVRTTNSISNGETDFVLVINGIIQNNSLTTASQLGGNHGSGNIINTVTINWLINNLAPSSTIEVQWKSVLGTSYAYHRRLIIDGIPDNKVI